MLHGWDKISADERRTITNGIRDNTVYGGPYHAEFSPTDACNYECFFCNSAFVDRSLRLKWDLMERTLNELIDMGVKTVRLAGGGEPLIYPEIEKFLDICIDRNIGISNLTTNAYKLTPKVIDKLLKLDTTEIIVSFNDVDAQRYAQTNGTTERAFHVVKENIANLMAERKSRGIKGPNVVQQFFLWKGNHDQIDRAYDLGMELNVDNVYVRDMYGIAPEKVMNEGELRIAETNMRRVMERDKGVGKLLMSFSNEKVLEEQKVHAEQQAEHKQSRRSFWRRELPTRDEYCYIAWYSTVIRGSGEVFPCCMLAVEPGYPALANVNEHPNFRSIWEGKNYAALRTELHQIAMGQGDYAKVSHSCYTRHYCAMRDACPFVASLATPEFYSETDAALDDLRVHPSAIDRIAGKLTSALTSHGPFKSFAKK